MDIYQRNIWIVLYLQKLNRQQAKNTKLGPLPCVSVKYTWQAEIYRVCFPDTHGKGQTI
jgi:hypothetical protein